MTKEKQVNSNASVSTTTKQQTYHVSPEFKQWLKAHREKLLAKLVIERGRVVNYGELVGVDKAQLVGSFKRFNELNSASIPSPTSTPVKPEPAKEPVKSEVKAEPVTEVKGVMPPLDSFRLSQEEKALGLPKGMGPSRPWNSGKSVKAKVKTSTPVSVPTPVEVPVPAVDNTLVELMNLVKSLATEVATLKTNQINVQQKPEASKVINLYF